MPIYEYQCQDCGAEFTALKSLSQCHSEGDCPDCGEPSPRVLITPPALRAMPATQRRAFEVNERSANEPRSNQRGGEDKRHAAGCGCCSGRTSATSNAGGQKSFPSRRPWMISH